MLDFSFFTFERFILIIALFAVGFLLSEIKRVKKYYELKLTRTQQDAATAENELRKNWREGLETLTKSHHAELLKHRREVNVERDDRIFKMNQVLSISRMVLMDAFFKSMQNDFRYLLTSHLILKPTPKGLRHAKQHLNFYVCQLALLETDTKRVWEGDGILEFYDAHDLETALDDSDTIHFVIHLRAAMGHPTVYDGGYCPVTDFSDINVLLGLKDADTELKRGIVEAKKRLILDYRDRYKKLNPEKIKS